MKDRLLFLFVLVLTACGLSFAVAEGVVFSAGLDAPFGPEPPDVEYASAVAVVDFETETLLYGNNHHHEWAPASLTKLVTIYTALEAAGDGRFSLDVPLPVHSEAWASAMPAGSSLMFLGPDQVVSGADLFRGLLVSSGNDAATEVAFRVAGSVNAFAREMNATMASLGFPEFYFEEPAGLSAGNRITAESFARFTVLLIRRWPRILEDYASLPSFSYPQPQHYPNGQFGGAPIRQYNRNTLIDEYPGADGLKTGFIEESGYNLVATAERNGRRLIVVILGVQGDTHVEGGRRRTEDARRLLDWGFDNYRRVEFTQPTIPNVTIWGGDRREVLPVASQIQGIVLPTKAVSSISQSIELTEDLWAPQAAGRVVGSVTYRVGDAVVAGRPIELPVDIGKASFPVRIFHRIAWWLGRLLSVLKGTL